MAEQRNSEQLDKERQLLSGRLTTFLIGNSILVLGFATIIEHDLYFPRVLSIIGLLFAGFSLAHFWRLPRKLDALEGIQERSFGRFCKSMVKGRGIGIPCSMLFLIFWICAIIWAF